MSERGMRESFVSALGELAERDRRIMLVTGDLGFGVFDDFRRRFPRQFLNAGVAEQNMTGVAVGLAREGRVVFTYSIGNFPTLRCLEQIRNDAAYHEADVKVVAIGGGFSYGPLGMSHHATEDLAITRALPGVTVVAPGCDWEVREAVSALASRPGTAYLRLDKSSAGDTSRDGERFVLGRARRVVEGGALTIACSGGILDAVLGAVELLSAEGTPCRVLSVHTLSPVDAGEIVAAARETGGILSVEEHVVEGGLGGAIAEICMEAGAIPNGFARAGVRGGGYTSTVGSQEYLRRLHGLDAESIAASARRLIAAIERSTPPTVWKSR